MSNILHYLETFGLSGATVTGISYVGNKLNPLAAGIISGVPISIPSMLLITGKQARKEFIWSAFIMVSFLAIITGFCALLFNHFELSASLSVSISFLTWCAGGYLYYIYITRKTHGKQ